MNINYKKTPIAAAIAASLLSLSCAHSVQAAVEKKLTKIEQVEKDLQDQEIELITVVGIKAGILRAQAIKADAASVVEALSIEDLGNFSDDSLADALQRVPGLQVEQDDSGTGGDRVSIRGIGPQFVVTTINGRTPMSSGGEGIQDLRSFNLNTIPTEILGAALIYKTPTAKNIESGLAGTVDLQTLKPLQIKKFRESNFFGQVKLQSTYSELSEQYSPRGSIMLGAKNDDDTLGGYVSVISAKDYRSKDESTLRFKTVGMQIDNNKDGQYTEEGDGPINEYRVPDVLTLNPIVEERERLGIATAIQWRPSENIDINLDYFKSSFDNRSKRNKATVNFGKLFSKNPSVRLFNPDRITIKENTVVAFDPNPATQNLGSGSDHPGWEYTAPTQTLKPEFSALEYDNFVDNEVYGLNFDWNNGDDLFINVDLSSSKVDFYQSLENKGKFKHKVNNADNIHADQNYVAYNALGDTPYITFGTDVIDPANLGFSSMIDKEIVNVGKNDAIAIDLSKYLTDDLILDVGVRYSKSSVDVRVAKPVNYTLSAEQQDKIRAQLGVNGLTDPFLEGVFPAQALNQWLKLDFDALTNAVPEATSATGLDDGIYDGDILTAASRTDDFPLSLGESFYVEEETLSLYAQLNLDFEIADMPVTTNFGVRGIKVSTEAIGFGNVEVKDPWLALDLETDADGDGDFNDVPDKLSLASAATIVNDEYWEVLPAFNINFNVVDNVNLRFSASKVMTRPKLTDIAPKNKLNLFNENAWEIDPEAYEDSPTKVATGKAGNVDLKPYTAIQYDTTLEWYTENGGAYYASVFYKDVSDYIVNQNVNPESLQIPEDPEGYFASNGIDLAELIANSEFDIIMPVNFSDGVIQGIEIGLNQTLDFLPWPGFGVQANYSYVDSKFDKNVGGEGVGFPGSSTNSANFTGYYENKGFSVRVAYAWRDDYLRTLGTPGSDRNSDIKFNEGFGNLSFNMSYRIIKGVQVRFSAANILDADLRSYVANSPEVVSDYTTRGRNYTLGLSLNF